MNTTVSNTTIPDAAPASETRALLMARLILGTPIPFLFSCYALSLLLSMAGMEILGWTTSVLGLIYIFIDRFSSRREFRIFRIGGDTALLGLLLIGAIGLSVNAPQADFLQAFAGLRWILLLYLLTYTLDLFPGLNKLFNILMYGATLVAAYAIYQHFTGVDLRYLWGLRPESAVTPAPVEGSQLFQNVGFFSHHLTYGDSFAMLICFPFATLLLANRKPATWRWLALLSTITILLSLVWTYGRGVWLSAFFGLAVVALFVGKRYVFSLVALVILFGGLYYKFSSDFQERFDTLFSDSYFSNVDRRNLWKANIAMFSDYPWLGVGYRQNEGRTQEYFSKLGIQSEFGGHAHNNYFQMLSTTGFLGFACYMLFILSFLFMTLRLWNEVPKTHFWHRVFVLGAFGAQVAFHVGGLTQWSLGDAEVNHLFIFILATMAYMNERYARGIVPDDYAL